MDKVWIGIVDADKSPEIAKKYKISGFPTFLIFKDSKLLERFSGLRDKEEIMYKLMEYIK